MFTLDETINGDGYLTKTNYDIEMWYAFTEAETIPTNVATTISCTYRTAPYKTTATTNGVMVISDTANDKSQTFTAVSFPVLALNTLSGVARPSTYQYRDGSLDFEFPSPPFPVMPFDTLSFAIPETLYFWNDTNPAVCSYQSVAMEYVSSAANTLKLIVTAEMANNDGYIRFSCEYAAKTVVADDTSVYTFPALPPASAFAALTPAELSVAVTVTSMATPTSASRQRYSGTLELVSTEVPVVGTGVTIGAQPSFVGALDPLLVLAASPLVTDIPAGQTIEFTLPSAWHVAGSVSAECRGGFAVTAMNDARVLGTTTITAVTSGVEVKFTPSSNIYSSETSGQTFRLFCAGVSVPLDAQPAASVPVAVTSSGVTYASTDAATVLAVTATEPDPEFVRYSVGLNISRPLYTPELEAARAVFVVATGVAAEYVTLGQQVFTPASNSEPAAQLYAPEYAAYTGTAVTAAATSASVQLVFRLAQTASLSVAELRTALAHTHKETVDQVGAALGLTVLYDMSSVDTYSVASACVNEDAECGGDCAQCGTGGACTSGDQCLSTVCEMGLCKSTNGAAAATAAGIVLAVLVAAMAL
jgi:hypothetical protein